MVLLAAALALMAACGGGDGDERASRPSPTPVPTRTPAPTRTATASATVAPEDRLDVGSALLVVDDLPPNWTVLPSNAADLGETALCGRKALDATPVSTSSTILAYSSVLQATHSVSQYAPGAAAQALEGAAQAVQSCKEWTGASGDGRTTTFTLTPLQLPQLGDQTLAVRLDIKNDRGVAQAELVFTRRGDVISQLALVSASIGAATVDTALTEQLARRADEKLAALVR